MRLNQPYMPTSPMQQALALAQLALPICPPNPAVGCVLLNAQGALIGQGHTQAVGGAHAEVMALADAKRQGHATQGATAYITLEPCVHFGRTPPCTEALIKAEVAQVVMALLDPNPLVAGKGLQRLQDAGITAMLLPGDSPEACAVRANMQGFFSRVKRQRPWLRLKMAVSLDGRSALENGRSQWITSPQARADVHTWRARVSCIATGIGTILADDPRLNVRLTPPSPRQPHLAILDRHLRTSLSAAFWKTLGVERRCFIYTQSQDQSKAQALREQGAEVLHIQPELQAKDMLTAIVADWGQRDWNEVHLESGPALNGAWLSTDLVDEILLYLAPKLLGPGLPLAQLPALTELAHTRTLYALEYTPLGGDLRILAKTRAPA